MSRGYMYLVAVMDWYSRKVLSWRLSNTLESDFCVEALQEALHRYGRPEIFNTDQGAQFTSTAFTQVLKDHGIKPYGMDGRGRCRVTFFFHRATLVDDQTSLPLPAFVSQWLRTPPRLEQLDWLLQRRAWAFFS